MVAPTQKLIENKQLTQLGLNRVLWKIVAARGSITIRASELLKLPTNAAIRIDHDANTDKFTLTAIAHQPSTIVMPDRRIVI